MNTLAPAKQTAVRRGIRTTTRALIARHPVRAYYILTFAISWGAFLAIGGPGLFAGTDWQSDPRFLPAVMAMLTGPTIACLVLTALLSGKGSLRAVGSRLLRWRVSARWYAIALLTTPILFGAVLLTLSRTSPAFLPAIITADHKAALLLSGIALACTTLLEEVGWTGFAIPRLRPRYGMLTTGLIVGVLWGVWHALQIAWVGRTSAGGLPMALYLPQYFLTGTAALTAYRVLMVWVFDHTESLLIATLMHASYAACTIVILSPGVSGASFLVYSWVFAAVLWVAVAAVIVMNRRTLARQPRRRRNGQGAARPVPGSTMGR